MASSIFVQVPGSPTKFGSVIAEMAAIPRGDSARVAAAYVTVSGVRSLFDAVRGTAVLRSSQWIVGLDDELTQPGAIELLRALENSDVRVAGLRYTGTRFHPKLFQFSDSSTGKSSLLVGSANLTKAALNTNVEAGVALNCDSGLEIERMQQLWAGLWECGEALTTELLDRYKEEYRISREGREFARETGRRVFDDDEGTVDPAHATTCWIEVGNITGFQAEQLEIKAEQALFFGVEMHGGPDKLVPLTLRSGQIVNVRLTYLGNFMWRFYLPAAIPEVAERGLRPGGMRSPFVAVFSREGVQSPISLHFLRVSEPEFQEIRSLTLKAGTLGRTTAREYGWF